MKSFSEKQKFRQWWLWLILIGIGLLPIIFGYQQFIGNNSLGYNPMSDEGLLLFTLLTFCLLGLFLAMKLEIHIDNKEVHFIFFPFVRKHVSWIDIKSAKVVNYGFVGGWGIRIGTKYGTVYNVNGKYGLALEFKNGKKVLIGTQKEKELSEFIKKLLN